MCFHTSKRCNYNGTCPVPRMDELLRIKQDFEDILKLVDKIPEQRRSREMNKRLKELAAVYRWPYSREVRL